MNGKTNEDLPSEMEEEQLHIETSTGKVNVDTHRCYSVNTYMLPAKIAYLFNEARYEITSYLMLFYTSTGLSTSEAGLVNGLQYIGGIVGAPLFGLLADKKGFHRVITICLCIMVIIAVCIQPYLGATFGNKDNNVCERKQNISNYGTKNEKFVSDKSLFYSLLVAAIFAAAFDGSIMSFIDAGILRRVETSPRKCNIGMQRYAVCFGGSLGSISYSLSIPYFPQGSVSCYVGIFTTYAFFAICVAISSYFLFQDVSTKKEESQRENVMKCLISHLKSFDTIFFLLSVLFQGIIQTLCLSYLFLFLKELNAPVILFGLSISFNAVSGIVIYIFSSKLIHIVGGTMNAMCISCFAWALRFLCIAVLSNPYSVLAIDIFHGFTFSLFKTASLQRVKDTSEVAIFTTMCGIVSSLCPACGYLVANVVGGMLYEVFGARKLFIGTSVACGLWSIITFCCILLKKYQIREYDVIID